MTADDRTAERRRRMNENKRRHYAEEAARYDQEMDFFERKLLGPEHRVWACDHAVGETLEVALGTGLNLPHYPPDVRLTGLDLSPEMLAIAKARAERLGRAITIDEGDAQNLPFADSSFDTVVCTYALCSVLDDAAAIAEMKRVLKPGGRLILLDHVRSSFAPIFWLQWLYEFVPSRTKGEYMTRRPSLHVMADDFEIQARERFRAGIVERLVAIKRVGGDGFEPPTPAL
jgi:ubiquinone/menaquinone biosynthesis C-methylase UbiE